MKRRTERVFPDRERCCGCGLCAVRCPVDAIAMREDAEGFRYPEIDPGACIRCGKCRTDCPFDPVRHPVVRTGSDMAVLGARLKDLHALAASQSGGVFAALARSVLLDGGVVYGAALEETGSSVAHRRVTGIGDLGPLLGSKYAQSTLSGDIYRAIRCDVAGGRTVLFSGTPCQAAAVLALWPDKRPSNLLVCDLICHSVASPRFWRDYVGRMRQRLGGQLVAVRFRDKPLAGWRRMVESFTADDGRILSGRIFARMFSSHLLFRPSCSRCPFTTPFRDADITLGDLWGVESVRPDWHADDCGASLVIVRTPIGQVWFRRAKEVLDCFPVSLKSGAQAQLEAPVPQPCGRRIFWASYRSFGWPWIRATLLWLRFRQAICRRIGKARR